MYLFDVIWQPLTDRQERVYEVRLDLRERLPLDNDGVCLVLVRRHERPEPRPLRQLRGALRGAAVGAVVGAAVGAVVRRRRLLGYWKGGRKHKIGLGMTRPTRHSLHPFLLQKGLLANNPPVSSVQALNGRVLST